MKNLLKSKLFKNIPFLLAILILYILIIISISYFLIGRFAWTGFWHTEICKLMSYSLGSLSYGDDTMNHCISNNAGFANELKRFSLFIPVAFFILIWQVFKKKNK